ncbi:hypothetical protein Taro_041123 [Colocasia esculenta]|uniref:Uncharacterized protein n=1 Tax=Colocasia esculenta TaxID=4460 RepID=A0A843WNW9_COLES|nr:hypothetical protein [Colocasia esculenta]
MKTGSMCRHSLWSCRHSLWSCRH